MIIDIEALDLVLSALEQLRKADKLDKPDTVLSHMEQVLELPLVDTSIKSLLLNPYILREYADALVVRAGFDNLGEERARRVSELIWKSTNDELFVRLRRFRPQEALYYGLPFEDAIANYTFLNEEPILVTHLEKGWKHELSELGWLSRLEVKILSTLSFSIPIISGPPCYLQFSDEVYDIPASLIDDKNIKLNRESLSQIYAVANIMRRLKYLDQWGFRAITDDASPFAFHTQLIQPKLTERLYRAFDLNDELALRTGFLLIKAATLWRQSSHLFGEEATANLFFALEGCLHLIYRRISSSAQFAFSPTIQHIEITFPEKPGYGRMIKDTHEKRIQITHPEPRNNFSWLPSLVADDFYENYGMAVDLFYYSITGEKLPYETT